jgi:hypothetical protein
VAILRVWGEVAAGDVIVCLDGVALDSYDGWGQAGNLGGQVLEDGCGIGGALALEGTGG